MKKYILPLLILIIVVQLCIPSYTVYEKYDTLKNGKEYKFNIELYDPYDPFRGRYVALMIERSQFEKYDERLYGHIAVDADGFAYIDSVSDSIPATGDYVKSSSRRYFTMPVDRYYTDEKIAPEMQNLVSGSNINKLHPYIILRVKNGNSVIQGLYIGSQRIEDYMKLAG